MGSSKKKVLASSIKKLYGREEEIQILRACINAAKQTEGSSVPLVFVGGLSGTGKTALIEHAFWKHKATNQSSLLGCGKFELTKEPTPYGILLQALRQISSAMVSSTAKETYSELLTGEFVERKEIKKLCDLMPELDQLFNPRSGQEGTVTQRTMCSKEELGQLKYLIRTFLRKISIHERPVILYLDDIQWVDALTLDLLRAILLDNELKHFVFVASYRNNEVFGENVDKKDSSPHKVAILLDTLKSSSRGSDVREMTISDLTLHKIQKLLQDILRTDQGTKELAELFVDRTGGNIFHTIELLEYLEMQGLLQYSPLDFQWTWDLGQLRDETMVTSNVVEILKTKIDLLSDTEVAVLKQFACLGYRFHQSVLPAAVSAAAMAVARQREFQLVNNGENNEDTLVQDEWLDADAFCEIFLRERLLERVSETHLKFTHDSKCRVDFCGALLFSRIN